MTASRVSGPWGAKGEGRKVSRRGGKRTKRARGRANGLRRSSKTSTLPTQLQPSPQPRQDNSQLPDNCRCLRGGARTASIMSTRCDRSWSSRGRRWPGPRERGQRQGPGGEQLLAPEPGWHQGEPRLAPPLATPHQAIFGRKVILSLISLMKFFKLYEVFPKNVTLR